MEPGLVYFSEGGERSWLAPVCASWIWLNLNKTKRRIGNGFFGDETYEPVILGNALAISTAVLLEFAAARGVEVAIENPPPSRIWKFKPLSDARAAAQCVSHTVTSRCAFEVTLSPYRHYKSYLLIVTATPSWSYRILQIP